MDDDIDMMKLMGVDEDEETLRKEEEERLRRI
jgi:hypothetical protein